MKICFARLQINAIFTFKGKSQRAFSVLPANEDKSACMCVRSTEAPIIQNARAICFGCEPSMCMHATTTLPTRNYSMQFQVRVNQGSIPAAVWGEWGGRTAVLASSPCGGRGEDTDLSHCLQGQGELSQESEQAAHSDAHQTGNSAAALGAAGRQAAHTQQCTQQCRSINRCSRIFRLLFAPDAKFGRQLSSGTVYVCVCKCPARICIFVYILREVRGGHLFSLSIAVHISCGRLAESHLLARTKNLTAAIKLVLVRLAHTKCTSV